MGEQVSKQKTGSDSFLVFVFAIGIMISPDTLQNIRQAQALYEEAKNFYEKAQNTKKLRETRSNIRTLQK